MSYRFKGMFPNINAAATFPTITTSVCTSGVNCATGQTCSSSSQCATGNCCAYVYNTTSENYNSLFLDPYPQYSSAYYFNTSANGSSYTTNPGFYNAYSTWLFLPIQMCLPNVNNAAVAGSSVKSNYTAVNLYTSSYYVSNYV